MRETFVDFPSEITTSIANLLAEQESADWVVRAQDLHERYVSKEKRINKEFITGFADALAYLALRVPATYAQIYGALSAVEEIVPSWKPKRMLDLGSGPGTGAWAARALFPSIEHITCIDQERDFLALGERIVEDTAKLKGKDYLYLLDSPSTKPLSSKRAPFSPPVSGTPFGRPFARKFNNRWNDNININWEQQDLRRGIEGTEQYDLVLLGNVLNELRASEGEKLLGQAFNACSGVLVIVETGTPEGSNLVASVVKKLSHAGNLLAPYVGNSYVPHDEYYLHFPQRFIRPEFERRVRQNMRDSSLMASDWEEAKYSYMAIGKMEVEKHIWGRCVGPVKKQKGFVEVPVLTKEKIEIVKVMKRHKEQYHIAKKLRWGEAIEKELSVSIPVQV